MTNWLLNLIWQAPRTERTIEQLIIDEPRVAELFSDLGHDPGLRNRSETLLTEMRSLVYAEIADFSAFRVALQAVAAKPEMAGKQFDIRNRELLEAVLSAGDDEPAVLAILNRNPVYAQIPFVEQIPVERSGHIIWVTPIEHTHIQKPARDQVRFEQLVHAFSEPYARQYPAHSEQCRLNILDAVTRLNRELKRDKPYLPTPLQLLTNRLSDFEVESIQPLSMAAANALRFILAGCEQIDVTCHRTLFRKPPSRDLRRASAEIAARYLEHPRLHQSWITSRILGTLLAPAALDDTSLPGSGVKKLVTLVRNELRIGSYDPAEMADRIRKLEAQGLYISSLAFPLLQLHALSPDQTSAKSRKALAQ